MTTPSQLKFYGSQTLNDNWAEERAPPLRGVIVNSGPVPDQFTTCTSLAFAPRPDHSSRAHRQRLRAAKRGTWPNTAESMVQVSTFDEVVQQRDTGKEQPTVFRFLQVNKSVAASGGAKAPGTLYFDSFAYVPSACASDVMAGCDAASDFFGAVLDTVRTMLLVCSCAARVLGLTAAGIVLESNTPFSVLVRAPSPPPLHKGPTVCTQTTHSKG